MNKLPTRESFSQVLFSDVKTARAAAHDQFDQLWKINWLSRHGAYRWLAAAMRLSKDEAHIELFDVEQCKRVIELSKAKLLGFHDEIPYYDQREEW